MRATAVGRWTLGVGCWVALFLQVLSLGGDAQEMEPEVYYTAVNIWCRDPRAIPTTNYHAGDIIPVGTRISLIKSAGIHIVFETDDKKKYTILHMVKHSRINLDKIFVRMFAVDDPLAPGGDFHKLTREEQKAVAEGTVVVGMSKAAVLMAYGYPPSHRTPDLDGKLWIYWRGRRRTVSVQFDDDKVESVKGLPLATPKKGR